MLHISARLNLFSKGNAVKISRVIYLLGLTISLTATGCSKASMGAKKASQGTAAQRPFRPIQQEDAKPADVKVAPPINTESARNKNISVVVQPDTAKLEPKIEVTPETPKSQPKQESAKAVVQEPTKQAPAQKPVVQKPVEQNKPVKRVLPVSLSYASQTEKYETNSSQDLIAELFEKNKVMTARRASNIGDENYETVMKNHPSLHVLYISNGLYDAIITPEHLKMSDRFYPCDLNVVGPCVVLEKDSASGKTQMRAYVVGSASRQEDYRKIDFVRKDFTDSALQPKIEAFLRDRRDGIYAFSMAISREETVALEANLISAKEAKQMIAADEQAQNERVYDAKIRSITEKSEKQRVSNEIDAAVEKFTDQKTISTQNFNKCSVVSSENKNPAHGMKTVRRIFIADFVNVIGLLSGKQELPLKIGKGTLNCKLVNGDVQKVNILIKEYISPLTAGLVLNRGKQNLYAAGVGVANGARDLLEIKDYYYLIEGEGLQVLAASALGAPTAGIIASAFMGNLLVAPIVLGSKDKSFVLAGVVSYSLKLGLPSVRVTIGGRYEITIDPDDT